MLHARLQAHTRASDISIPLPLVNGLWIHSMFMVTSCNKYSTLDIVMITVQTSKQAKTQSQYVVVWGLAHACHTTIFVSQHFDSLLFLFPNHSENLEPQVIPHSPILYWYTAIYLGQYLIAAKHTYLFIMAKLYLY